MGAGRLQLTACQYVDSAADTSFVLLGQSRIRAVAASDESGEMFNFNWILTKSLLQKYENQYYYYDQILSNGSRGAVILY